MSKMENEENLNKTAERLSSQEEIHHMLTIEEPKNWLMIGAILTLILTLIIWSFVGRIPTEANGRSVTLSPDGVFLIRSNAPGMISEIYQNEGTFVEKNTPIAKIDSPAIRAAITGLETTKHKIAKLKIELGLLKHAYSINTGLFEQGLIAKMVLDDSQAKIIHQQISIEEAKSELATIASDLENLSPSHLAETFVKKALLSPEDLPLNLPELEAKLSLITASSSGTILEVLVNLGDHIEKKESLIWMEYPRNPLELEYFYSAVNAEMTGRIKQGMEVIIEPNIVNPQEYGAIRGIVKEIFPYPVSKEELTQTIGNKQIVEFLLGKSAAITNILINPLPNSHTVSGYEWTSKEGPPYKIPTGTLCKVKIIIDEQPPISYLVPLWKIKMR
ncbi:MAG: hypothetical protein KAR79_02825 [Simkaniaceae bacterium]|nr:hypothetical protein [Simkaniaceae bacterium]